MSTRDRQREQTRQRIYAAALAVFRRDGVANCRTEDIAQAAGVSRGAFYFHFPTKEHVLLARMAETEEQICAAVDALGEDAPLAEVLACTNAELAAIWEPDPQLLPELTSAAMRFTATAMSDQQATRLRSTLADRFARALARGEAVARLPAPLLSDLYLGNTLAGLLAWYANPVLSLRAVLDGVTELFWNGARAPGRDEASPADAVREGEA